MSNYSVHSLGETDKSGLLVSKRSRKEHHIAREVCTKTSVKCTVCVQRMTREKFVKLAIENCKKDTVTQWLRENSESESFFQLVDMFHFLKKRIDEEEEKNHSREIDIIFMAHGSIRDSMVPACCLLPLPTIADVLLYAPWNCVMSAEAGYGIAAGCMKPRDRIFYRRTEGGRQIPQRNANPTKVPDCWNSMKEAGDQMVPNILLSPFEPSVDSYWQKFQSLVRKYGAPDRNRVIIPYILPGHGSGVTSVPFFVVTLAMSLALRSSRFRATLHLATCLGDKSSGQFCRKYLRQQYACTVDETIMTFSI